VGGGLARAVARARSSRVPGRPPLSHTAVTPIVFLRNSDTHLFVAAVLGYSIVPIR
jgi:hypothetical protein